MQSNQHQEDSGKFRSHRFAISLLAVAASALVLLAGASRAQEMCVLPAADAPAPDVFRIDLIRTGHDTVDDNGQSVVRTVGDIGVNGQNIGRFYENPDHQIAAGTYEGVLRYHSNHQFVESACGVMSQDGDFLLEIAGVTNADGTSRSNILLHPGFLPSQSEGCVLMGARQRGPDGLFVPLGSDDPLYKLRQLYYGTDNPISCPNKEIVITVGDH